MAEKKQTTKKNNKTKIDDKEVKKETPQEEAKDSRGLIQSVGVFFATILRWGWSLIKRFIGVFITIFKKLGFILSILLVVIMALGIWGTYSIGYTRGENQAIENLAEEYDITREGIIELLDQGSRTFSR